MKNLDNRGGGWRRALCLTAAFAPFVSFLPGFPGLAQADQSSLEKSMLLDEVVVTATRTPHTMKDVPLETVVITRQEIERSNARNVMAALKTVPGITSTMHDDVFGTYTWRAKMRGLNFNDGYGLILIDGQRVMGCGQSGGMGEYGIGLNQVPVEMIERIEIVKGPGSALYGSDAMAGVVNIITKKSPEKPSGQAGVSYGWYKVKEKVKNDGSKVYPSDDGHYRNSSQAYVSFGDRPLDRLGYLINYNYESAEDVREDPIQSDRHSLLVKTDFDATDNINIFLKGEASDYQKKGNRDEDSYRLSAGFTWEPTDKYFLMVKGYTYNWDFVHGYPGYSYGYKHGDTGFDQAEIQYTWYGSADNVLTMGGEIQQQSIDYVINNADNSTIQVNEDVDIFSLYGQDEITLFDNLTMVAGLRFDNHSNFSSEVNPKLSLMYQVSEATILRASAGRAFKSPTIRQLYYSSPYRHGDYYVQSNRDLKPETGVGYSAGVEQWLLNGNLMTSVSLFRNDVDDMVIREDSGTLYDGLPLMIYQNVESAYTQGVEFMAKADFQGISLDIAYTYTDSENKESNRDLTYVPKHSFSISPAYEWKEYGLGVSGVFVYTGRQYKDTANTSQIDANSVVDARIYKDLADKARLSFEATNIFDSDKGDDGNFRGGRTLLVKMDVFF